MDKKDWRNLALLCLSLFALLALMAMPGCISADAGGRTKQERILIAAELTWTVAEFALENLHRDGHLSDSQMEKLALPVAAIEAALKTLREAVNKGGNLDVFDLLVTFRAAIDALNDAIFEQLNPAPNGAFTTLYMKEIK